MVRALLLASFSCSAALAAATTPFVPPPNRPGESAWIQLRHQSQERNLCVPTSASIILEHLGDRISPRELKALSRGRTYDPEEVFEDFTLTLYRDLIAGLSRRGYRWRERTFPNDASGLHAGLWDIERSLDEGVPVMIDTTLHRGHTLVVCGYSAPDMRLFAVDPNLAAPGIRVLTFQELDRVWNSSPVGFNGRAVILPKPR